MTIRAACGCCSPPTRTATPVSRPSPATHYEGGHWLGTFAVYLETMDLEGRPKGMRRVR